jgi:hypothetical protein
MFLLARFSREEGVGMWIQCIQLSLFKGIQLGWEVSIWRDQLIEEDLGGFVVIFDRSHLRRICPSRISALLVVPFIADIIKSWSY